MKIEGSYIVLNKDEYLKCFDFLNKNISPRIDHYGYTDGYELNKKLWEESTYSEEFFYAERILIDLFSMIKLSKRFDIDKQIIERKQGDAWNKAIEILFSWKDES